MLIASCSSYNEDVSPINNINGIYCSSPKNGLETYYIERRTGYKIRDGMWVACVILRADSSFLLGSCDYQILEMGNYKIENDSVVFYNRLSMKTRKEIKQESYFYDVANSDIYFTYENANEESKLVILGLNDFRHHDGFLRNQDMSLDSIIRHNEYWSLERQLIWLDSINTEI